VVERDVHGRFVKGHSGNPLGRAKRKTEEEYLEALSKRVSLEAWLAIIDQAVQDAKDGEWRAREWISGYLVGTVAHVMELRGAGGGPIELLVIYDDPIEGAAS
jgi:hypothetical protein